MRRFVLLSLSAATVAATAVPAALAAPGAGHAPAAPAHKPAVYLVGGGVESINPPASMLAAHDFYLGGYGISDYKAANQVGVPGVDGRYATGILGDGVHSRALAVSDRAHTIVLSQIETQGYFASYKQGPFGIEEIRHDASAAIAALAAAQKHAAPVPTAAQILVDSDHSHGGPDTVGVWGGVPTAYLQLVHDRTVAAIVDAWQALRPATLSYGVTHAGVVGETSRYPAADGDPLLTNQFSNDPVNQEVDDEIRVLQARDPDTGRVLDTYVNFSGHPTVLGSSNTAVTPDYVGRVSLMLQQAYGGFGFDQVATLGRTQPSRADCATSAKGDGDPATALCKLDGYAARVVRKVKAAVAAARPLTGSSAVSLTSYYVTDPSTSAALVSLLYGGEVVGAPIARSANPPWTTGNVIGTTAYSGRIGDLLLSGGPGEMYPQIVAKVRSSVPGMRGYLNLGTAGDFLGYIIAPLEAYPEPIRRSFLSGDPAPAGDPSCAAGGMSVGCPDPIGNDNFFFNSSQSFGERLTCALLRGAGDTLAGDPTRYWSTYDRCVAFTDDLAKPAGMDTTFPAQPDLSAALPHM